MIELGGHLLPGGVCGCWVFAVGEPTGLAGLFGDRDVEFRVAGGGEVGVAGVPGAEQRRADLGGDL
jgi:hypothetical protein